MCNVLILIVKTESQINLEQDQHSLARSQIDRAFGVRVSCRYSVPVLTRSVNYHQTFLQVRAEKAFSRRTLGLYCLLKTGRNVKCCNVMLTIGAPMKFMVRATCS